MVKFYICNAFVQNVADSESCIILRKLEEAKILNLSKNGHVWATQWPTSCGLKNKYDPHTEKDFDGKKHKIHPMGASGALPKLKFHKMRLGAVFRPYI